MIRNILIKGINYCNILQEKISKKMEKIFSNIKIDKTILFVFISIFIVQFFYNGVIYMYYDDFGNASLSYSYWTPNVNGTNFTINQLLEWAKEIYFNWGGRILYAILFIIPLLRNGIKAYMFVQSLVVTFIIYYMYKIIKLFSKNKCEKGKVFIPIALVALYLCIDMYYLQHGIYWASASVLYLWPMLPFFAFIYYYLYEIKNIESGNKINFFKVILLIILGFFATFSQEQIGAGVIVFFIVCILCHHLKQIKKYLAIDIPILITIILSFVILFIAPGNWSRMNTNVDFSNLSFFGKIALNYPNILKEIFLQSMKYYMVILTAIMFYMIFDIFIDGYIKNGNRKTCLPLLIIVILSINYIIVKKTTNMDIQQICFVIFGTLWFLSMLIVSIIYFMKNKMLEIISIEFAAVATIFCLVVSPVVGGRTSIPYLIFIILLCVLFMQKLLEKSFSLKVLCYILTAIILCCGIKVSLRNYEGYKKDYAIHQLNFELLQNYKPEDGDEIVLYKVADSFYGSFLSYQRPEMDFWIREYFDIDHSVKFKWVDIYAPLR